MLRLAPFPRIDSSTAGPELVRSLRGVIARCQIGHDGLLGGASAKNEIPHPVWWIPGVLLVHVAVFGFLGDASAKWSLGFDHRLEGIQC